VPSNPPQNQAASRVDQMLAAAARLGEATHAGFAMVTAAKLDRFLEFAITANIPSLNREMKDKLYGEFGLLRDFSSKILLAHCLGLIDRENYKRLNGIRRIRNLFAHSNNELNMQSPELQELITKEFGADASIRTTTDLMNVAIAAERAIAEAINAAQRR